MEKKNFQPTIVNEYFAWLEQTVNPDTDLYRAAHAYMEQARTAYLKEEPTNGPFLSIVTRTQGKRSQMLEEVLLSLTGQTNTDFELLIMGHNLSDEQHKTVTEIINEQPKWMRERTRLIPVNGGTRTTPLNCGFEEAKGKYIVILDDDDLVFDHWVETFYNLHLQNNGKILHTYSVVQDWETVSKKMPDTPRAASAPSTIYCQDFKMLDQLILNRCPLCALAFPAYLFHKIGVRFDESLTTTEDWDYLMRAAFLVGVADSPQITFLYRRWINTENSATLHSENEWKNNYARIMDRFVNTPIVFPAGSLHGIIDKNILTEEETDATDSEVIHLPEQDLFYDDGTNEFSDTKRFKQKIKTTNSNQSEYCFVADKRNQNAEITRLRFDPQFYGFLTVKKFSVRVIDCNDEETEYTMDDVTTNGYRFENRIAFLKNDPQIIFDLKGPTKIKEVMVECRVRHYVSDDDLDRILRSEPHRSLLYRAVRKVYRLLKKVFKRL